MARVSGPGELSGEPSLEVGAGPAEARDRDRRAPLGVPGLDGVEDFARTLRARPEQDAPTVRP
ncbi:hypothetical protein [Kitasatospora sp. NPDC057223]|uniref:hypothetical protein n=1 Tax=Kitasatospora sp. NPDC057223 TaxID=3346055 RepID=UPI0036411EF6